LTNLGNAMKSHSAISAATKDVTAENLNRSRKATAPQPAIEQQDPEDYPTYAQDKVRGKQDPNRVNKQDGGKPVVGKPLELGNHIFSQAYHPTPSMLTGQAQGLSQAQTKC